MGAHGSRSGPAPKPTALRRMEGNPAHRPLPKNEPTPETKIPKPPSFLDPIAKKEWGRLAPQLERLGLISELDMAAFAGYCQNYARWCKAEREIKAKGMVFSLNNGYVMQRPEVGIASTAMKQMRDFCVEFGLTPAARSRIQLKPDETKEDDMDQLLESGRAKLVAV